MECADVNASDGIREYAFFRADNLVMRALGSVHPSEGLVASVRYVDRHGVLVKAPKYGTMEQQPETLALQRRFLTWIPLYAMYCAVVPVDAVDVCYDPIEYYGKLTYNSGSLDARRQLCLDVGMVLEEVAGVPKTAVGVGGSVLLGLDRDGSDVDLHVYGYEYCRAVAESLDNVCAALNAARASHSQSLKLRRFLELRGCADTTAAVEQTSRRSVYSILANGGKIDLQYIYSASQLVRGSMPDVELGPEEEREFRVLGAAGALYYPGFLECEDAQDRGKALCRVVFRDKACQFLREGDVAVLRCRTAALGQATVGAATWLDEMRGKVYVAERLMMWHSGSD